MVSTRRRWRRCARTAIAASRHGQDLRSGAMGQAIGDLLPAAIGVAISPVPIIAIILMLGTPKARSNGPAFAAGWVLGWSSSA